MPYLQLEAQGDEFMDDERVPDYSCDGEATVRISNPEAENGCEQEPGPLTWLNSARITTDPEDDAVHCLVSVGDPRGAFCFTVRRTPDGTLLLHLPHPGEGMAHESTRQICEGTLEVVHYGTEKPIDYSDSDDE